MTPGESSVRRRIATELAAAELAREQGKEGMVRVCARRAAGAAVAAWVSATDLHTTDAIALLRRLEADGAVPPAVRRAAGRLTARITPDFTPAHAEDPIIDARTIIAYCSGAESAG